MSWPSLESFIPEPLRGGPIPDDVAARALERMREGWQRYAARRVHGAPDRALALVAFSPGGAPYAFVFDGRTCEAASPALGGVPAAMAELPGSGMVLRQGGNVLWRESLTDDQAAQRWRALGGDEAFGLPIEPGARLDALEAYALVRRGHDRVRVALGDDGTRAWAQRLAPFLRADVRAALLGD